VLRVQQYTGEKVKVVDCVLCTLATGKGYSVQENRALVLPAGLYRHFVRWSDQEGKERCNICLRNSKLSISFDITFIKIQWIQSRGDYHNDSFWTRLSCVEVVHPVAWKPNHICIKLVCSLLHAARTDVPYMNTQISTSSYDVHSETAFPFFR
jgi:hypothetical protein